MIDKKRLGRYNSKLALIIERVEDIKTWIGARDKKSKLAVYKAFQEVVESSMDLCAIIIKDNKNLPSDDYTNLGLLEESGLIDEKLKKRLMQANGLRNRLVHHYNGVEDVIALKGIKDLIKVKVFESFTKCVERWLAKKSSR